MSEHEKKKPDARKPFEHYCWCGAWGSFGYGVNARQGVDGEWFCFQHKPDEGKQNDGTRSDVGI